MPPGLCFACTALANLRAARHAAGKWAAPQSVPRKAPRYALRRFGPVPPGLIRRVDGFCPTRPLPRPAWRVFRQAWFAGRAALWRPGRPAVPPAACWSAPAQNRRGPWAHNPGSPPPGRAEPGARRGSSSCPRRRRTGNRALRRHGSPSLVVSSFAYSFSSAATARSFNRDSSNMIRSKSPTA